MNHARSAPSAGYLARAGSLLERQLAGAAAGTEAASTPHIEDMVARVAAESGWAAFPRPYRVMKRALDIAVASVGLVLLAPLMLAIALLVRLDSPGPAFFRQARVGQGGRPFQMLKFRSMVHGCGLRLDGPHKCPDDVRITRVGRLLRRTSLDELPQLINVLRGEMSLVGPRPEIPAIVLARYQPWQYRRFLVPQGMTGWWQVTGRGTKLLCEHIEDDLYYLEHASLRFDLLILAKTVGAVLRREGAF
ncbi:MAG: sugar transferase [Sphaerobacter sp.]|nr:sugar transferase [Sphaerobacter sp.]